MLWERVTRSWGPGGGSGGREDASLGREISGLFATVHRHVLIGASVHLSPQWL